MGRAYLFNVNWGGALEILYLFVIHLLKGAGLQSGIQREAPLARLYTITPWSQDLLVHKSSRFPGEHTARLPFFGARNYSNTQAFTVLPGTHLLLGRESARVSKVPCLGAHAMSEHIQRSRGSNPRSLACTSRTLPLSPVKYMCTTYEV